MNEKLRHWYDGRFYDKFIAPNQDEAFRKVLELIPAGSAVLDAGCGTGRLCFQLSGKCGKIDGVDPSDKNINTANENLDLSSNSNIRFHNSDIKTFLVSTGNKYNYAVISYVIHEVKEIKREEILNLLSEHSDIIIAIDYLAPHPRTLTGIVNRIVEFLAGRAHYKNFRSYLLAGGLKGLAEKTGLSVTKEIRNAPRTSHIMVLSKIKDQQK